MNGRNPCFPAANARLGLYDRTTRRLSIILLADRGRKLLILVLCDSESIRTFIDQINPVHVVYSALFPTTRPNINRSMKQERPCLQKPLSTRPRNTALFYNK